MSNVGEVYLGLPGEEQLLSAYGRKLSRRRIEARVRKGRTLSGRLVKDVMSKKWEYNLQYEMCDIGTLLLLQSLYELNTELSLIVHYRTGTTETHTVLMEPFGGARETIEPQELWSGVNVLLEEV